MRRHGTGITAVAVAGAALAVLVGACLPAPATVEARQVAGLYATFVAIAAVVAIIVLGLALFAVLRYRRRPDDDTLPRQVHGDLRLELLWTGIPIVTIVVLLILSVGVLNGFDAAVRATPGAEIRVTAFRWGWRFEYPRDGVTVVGTGEPGPEMVVPYGESIALTLGSADVQHAWYVPQFLVKHDVYPGRTARLDLLIERPGTYGAQCAEFCGLLHDRMPFTVRAVSPAEYAAWLEGQRAAARDAGLVPGHMP